jgi:hypothetical protein
MLTVKGSIEKKALNKDSESRNYSENIQKVTQKYGSLD